MTAPRPMPKGFHRCPCDCGGHVPNRLYSCKPSWFRLPRDLRQQITGNRIGSEEHALGMIDARRWFRENPAPK